MTVSSPLMLRVRYNQPIGPSQVSLSSIYICGHLAHSHHQSRLSAPDCPSFASRAFRRPAARDEVEKYVRFYALARNGATRSKKGSRPRLRQFCRARVSVPDRKGSCRQGAAPVNPYELASRLSYFFGVRSRTPSYCVSQAQARCYAPRHPDPGASNAPRPEGFCACGEFWRPVAPIQEHRSGPARSWAISVV